MLLHEDNSSSSNFRDRNSSTAKQSCRALEVIPGLSPVPELSRLILESEYDTILHGGQVSTEIIMGLQMIKEFAWHIHYDEDYYSYLLSTDNLWGNSALEYAALTFYPNLPEDIKTKYGIRSLIQYVPESMFRLDDF